MGYHLHGMRYHEVELDAERKLYSAATGLYLGIREGWLRWLTARAPWCQHRWAAEREKLRAEQAEQRAEQAEQRAEQAEQLVAMYRRRFGDLEGGREQGGSAL